MLNFSYEDALKNFSSLVDNVVTEHAVVSVSRSPKESVVMLSKDDYDSIRQSSVPASAHTSWSSSPTPSPSFVPHSHNSLDDWF
ncbi:type II toxin-antitoxin system Phd/YefM family antitoxin [Glutamicibacter sp.]|jgi:prevent-host-death family protein|uniref:type II toxin-antitoxin system Phd/YefM family antitoxin n=1 Tax=Glutamicibacter sp. TaxID=1931995 RepID=UPI0039C8BB6C